MAEKFLPEEEQETIFIAIENAKEELEGLVKDLDEKAIVHKNLKEQTDADPAELKNAKMAWQQAQFKVAKLNTKIKHLSDKLFKNVTKEFEVEFAD